MEQEKPSLTCKSDQSKLLLLEQFDAKRHCSNANLI